MSKLKHVISSHTLTSDGSIQTKEQFGLNSAIRCLLRTPKWWIHVHPTAMAMSHTSSRIEPPDVAFYWDIMTAPSSPCMLLCSKCSTFISTFLSQMSWGKKIDKFNISLTSGTFIYTCTCNCKFSKINAF